MRLFEGVAASALLLCAFDFNVGQTAAFVIALWLILSRWTESRDARAERGR